MSKPADDVPDLVVPSRRSSTNLPAATPGDRASQPRAAPASNAGPKSKPGVPAGARTSGTLKKPPPSNSRSPAAGYLGGDAESSLVGVSMGAMGTGEDDPFADDDDGPGIDLAIDKKALARASAPQVLAPMPMMPMETGGPASVNGAVAAPPVRRPPTPAEKLAAYGDPPAKIWQCPIYAVQVLKRQHELRTRLAELRQMRSPDVALHAEAMTVYDKTGFARGVLIIAVTLMFFALAFVSPVIMRFWRLATEG